MMGSFVKAGRIKLAIRREQKLREACNNAEIAYAEAVINHKTAAQRLPGNAKTAADADMVTYTRLNLLRLAEEAKKEWDRLADLHLAAEQRVRGLLATAPHLRTPLIGMIQGAILSFTLMLFAPEFHTALLKIAASVRASAEIRQAETTLLVHPAD